MNHAKCYRAGYPRPRFVRESFVSLDGEWDFSFDDADRGETEHWNEKGKGERKILVPYAYQTKKSGVGDESRHDHVWYFRTFRYSLKKGRRLLINFEGADYRTKVYLNGQLLGVHVGGYSRFTFDCTPYLKDGENALAVKCDDSYSQLQARGKQRYVEKNISCFYTDTTGIWKSVWLEEVAESYLESVLASCEYEKHTFVFEYRIARYCSGLSLAVQAEFGGELVAEIEQKLFAEEGTIRLDSNLTNKVLNVKPWTAGNPAQFYDVKYLLKLNGKVIDEVGSYTGLVDYRVQNGMIQINYLPNTYFRMVLDQGYYEGGLTATEEELLRDVRLIKELGFNGVRMHQKIEDDRFYYFCDMLGVYCWIEMPSMFDYTPAAAAQFEAEWLEIVRAHKGFLSIMAYVPVNESWGVLQTSENKQMQAFTAGLYYATHAVDPTRLVISNDGWEHTVSDIATLHNYAQTGRELLFAYHDMEGFFAGKPIKDLHARTPYANGWQYRGEPVILSEFGGVKYVEHAEGGWGYGSAAATKEEYISRLTELTEAVLQTSAQGYCYTQFTDVMQEMNGLLTEEREPKIPIEEIRKINSLPRK